MIPLAAAASPSPLWYLTRGTGAVALILLTVTLCLGVADARRVHAPGVPRFVVDELHRYASLLAVVFVFVHVATTILDGYAPIQLVAVVIPGLAAYRPLWLGFGAVAVDLLLAVLVTSLVRQRLGHRPWRLIHWLAYASWPAALLHGLGSGSDSGRPWGVALTAACVGAVSLSVLTRCAQGWPKNSALRGGGALASLALPLGLAVWLPAGPLAPGWARRAGTPTTLLASGARAAAGPVAPTASGGSPSSFRAALTGTERSGAYGDELAQVQLQLSFRGHSLSYLGIRIIGRPLNGGVAMTASRVDVGSAGHHSLYRGQIISLDGSRLSAAVASATGRRLTVSAALRIDPGTRTVTGTATFTPSR